MPVQNIADRRGRVIAETVMHRLLDRFESKADRQNRIIERLPKEPLLYDEQKELHRALQTAEASGGVMLENGKHDERDHIVKIILVNPAPLYALLGRPKPSDTAAIALQQLQRTLEGLPNNLQVALQRVADEWSRKRNLVHNLGPEDVPTAIGVFRAAQALLARHDLARHDDVGMDMRTFSRRHIGNSKFVENNMGRIADLIRLATAQPEYLNADEVLAVFGIVKFPQPCLLAGPVSYRGTRLPAEPFIGIAPEMVKHLAVTGRPRWLLTIENLASFNRQIREAMTSDGIVIYTGGFPSDSTLAAILKLANQVDCPILHWGDIDSGGIKIAYRLEQALSRLDRRLLLHLMSPEIAMARGVPHEPEVILRNVTRDGSILGRLLSFMASPDSHTLEQEELDPVIPSQKDA